MKMVLQKENSGKWDFFGWVILRRDRKLNALDWDLVKFLFLIRRIQLKIRSLEQLLQLCAFLHFQAKENEWKAENGLNFTVMGIQKAKSHRIKKKKMSVPHWSYKFIIIIILLKVKKIRQNSRMKFHLTVKCKKVRSVQI